MKTECKNDKEKRKSEVYKEEIKNIKAKGHKVWTKVQEMTKKCKGTLRNMWRKTAEEAAA